MTQQNQPRTKVGAKISAKLNLGNYNHVEFTEWIEDSVREDLDDGKASNALDRLSGMLDVKLAKWAEEYDDSRTE